MTRERMGRKAIAFNFWRRWTRHLILKMCVSLFMAFSLRNAFNLTLTHWDYTFPSTHSTASILVRAHMFIKKSTVVANSKAKIRSQRDFYTRRNTVNKLRQSGKKNSNHFYLVLNRMVRLSDCLHAIFLWKNDSLVVIADHGIFPSRTFPTRT